MAGETDSAKLLVSIEAGQRRFEKQMAQIAKQAADTATGIENRFQRANDNAGRSFDSGGKKAIQSLGAQRAAVQNLSFQLNDIATSLAGGVSPFQVMMQQGSQVTQVLNGAGGISGALTTIGGAFASVLNPVSLLTFAIIGLGGAAAQYFASMLSGGEESSKVLEEQARLIQQVADRWGDAIPALKEYADELKRAQEAGDLQKGLAIVKDRDLADIRGQVDDAKATIADLVSQLQAAGEESESILALQRAFNDFTSAADDGRDVTQEVERVQSALAAAINSTGIPALAGFSAMFDQLAASAHNASAGVQAAATAAAQAQARMNDPRTWRSFGRTDQNADGTIQGADTVLPDNGPSPERRPLIELEGLPSTGGGGRKRGGGKSEAEREADAIKKLIEALEFEQSVLGQTDEQRRVSNELRKAGSSATDTQKARITELVTAIEAERQAIKQNEKAMKDLQDLGRDALGGFVSDLRSGKSAADALAGAMDRVMSKLIDGALDSLFTGGLFGAGKGGLFGGSIIPGILHSGGTAGADGYGHGRAFSPSTFAGAKRYHTGGIAGLQPGEIPAILQRGEVVLPRGTTLGGKRSTETINIALQADPSLIASIADQRIETRQGTIVNVAVSRSNKSAPAAVGRYQAMKAGGDYRND